jgi:hypothetical protein
VAPTVQALFRHIVVGGLWHPVKRRAEQELISELTQGRYPSFPFISPDTFRALCDVVIENNHVTRRSLMAARSVIFFDLAEIEGTESRFDDSPSLGLLELELQKASEPPVVIMSHGDFLPSTSLLTEIGNRSARLFTINVVDETEKIRAIPLGLENFSRNRNGRLKDYMGALDSPSEIRRTRDVFTAFEPENNPSVRGPLVEMLRSSRFGWSPRRMSPEQYRQAVSESMFVLSPPGRGMDCHRTWEAIYLGAVPVVLEGSLPPGLLHDLPIHAVSSYEHFLNLSHSDMAGIFQEVCAVNARKAYMPFWVDAVMASAHE